MKLTTGEDDSGRRLDRVLRKALPDCPLALLHRFLRKGLVSVDGRPQEGGFRVNAGSVISVPSLSGGRGVSPSKPRSPLPPPEILWQGRGLLALNKPAGLAVHAEDGARGAGGATLDDIARSYLAGKLPPSLSFRPGPLHRLDKPSSGIVVFSTSIEGARFFSEALREGSVRKFYMAVLEGCFEKEALWEDSLVRDKNLRKTFLAGGSSATATAAGAAPKAACTSVFPIAAGGGYSLVKMEIKTGRTHQIRAQAAAHGFPLAGDCKYGASPAGHALGKSGFFLHAWRVEFQDVSIEAPLPPAFAGLVKRLFNI